MPEIKNTKEMIKMENPLKLQVNCPCCGQKSTVTIDEKDYNRYLKGESYVQKLFPYLDAADREVLITGYCRKCQEEIFNMEEEL